MSAGFSRRYAAYPSLAVLTQIEGIVIIDSPQPGPIQGVGVGTVAMVGEFPDQTFATNVVNGVVTGNPQAVQVFTTKDMIQKTGGFDPTLGDFGQSGGNGWVELSGKQFSALVLVPVCLLTSAGTLSNNATRMYRLLPGCVNATGGSLNAGPIVPIQGYTVPVTTQFNDVSNHRANSAGPVTFTALGAYGSGVDGVGAASTTGAATQVFTSAGSNFQATGANALGVQVGDILVVGSSVGGTVILSTGSATVGQFRVTAVASATTLTVEAMNGNITLTYNAAGFTAQPWRLHHASDADSGAVGSGTASGYTIPTRALDATVASSAGAPTALSPQVAVSSTADTSWLPNNGLTMLVQKGTTVGPVYIANMTASNPASNSDMDAAYVAGIQALSSASTPANSVNIAFTARHSQVIHNNTQTFVDSASAIGIGRVACISPPLSIASVSVTELQVLGPSSAFSTSCQAIRDERIFYSWPPLQTFVPAASGIPLKGSDGSTVTNGQLDTFACGWLAAVCSNINPENNPGQAAQPVPTVMSPVLGYARGVIPPQEADYVQFRASGICASRLDATVGPIFQSGVTSSLTNGQTNINRRRMADYIEDSIASALAPLSKLPLTISLQDDMVTESDAFMNQLLSPNNPAAQRINSYSIDDQSGNTATQEAAGVFVIIYNVRMLPTADVIVAQFNIGPNVVIASRQAVA